MKIIILSLLIIFGLTGCYTVIWLPSDEMPKTHPQNDFYNSEFYGEYYDYYSTPWWIINPINIYNPSENISDKNDRDRITGSIRNESGERNFNDRISPNRTEYSPPVTTQNQNNSGSNTNNSQSNNNKGSQTTTTNEEHTRAKSNSSNDSGSLRNENGNRNSDNSRR